MKKLLVAMVLVVLAGCFDVKNARVSSDQAALIGTVGVVTLLTEAPTIHYGAQAVTHTNDTLAALPGWSAHTAVTAYMNQRLKGKGFKPVEIPVDAATRQELEAAYDNPWAYPRPERIRDRLYALGVANNADMVVVVYRQVTKDFIGESKVENVRGYGLYNSYFSKPHVYAAVFMEALDARHGSLIGSSEGQKSVELPAELWHDDYATAKTPKIPDTDVGPVTRLVQDTLLAAVLAAAQETGVSH